MSLLSYVKDQYKFFFSDGSDCISVDHCPAVTEALLKSELMLINYETHAHKSGRIARIIELSYQLLADVDNGYKLEVVDNGNGVVWHIHKDLSGNVSVKPEYNK